MSPEKANAKRFRVVHHTRYVYEEKVPLSYHQAMLEPRNAAGQQVEFAATRIEPPVRTTARRKDYFGNHVTLFDIADPHQTLHVTAESEIDLEQAPPPELGASLPLEEIGRRLRKPGDDTLLAAAEYVAASPLIPKSPELAAFARHHFTPARPYLEGVRELMERVFRELRYDPEATHVATPVQEVLEHKHGVCQDFAQLMIACLRSLGGPARYVSGYLVPLPGVVGAQASHAWVSAYCPSVGWVDFDPTNNSIASGGHITLAWGRDFSDVSPLRGVVFGGGEHSVQVEVSVAPEGAA
jgi:transglutaminase-like putative cysteine protease